MSKEGYLLLHEEGRRSQIYYCVLGEGRLQFYSRRDRGVLVRDVVLSKAKLKIRGVPDHEGRDCPFSFHVTIQRSKIVDGRQILYGKPLALVLSAPSWAERKSWGNSIHSWQRNYWGEPVHQRDHKTDEEVEAFFQDQLRGLESALCSATMPVTASMPSPSKLFFKRAKSLKSMGSSVRKSIRSASVTFSLPPMGLNMSAALQQHRPQQQQQQQPQSPQPQHDQHQHVRVPGPLVR